jgi:hypothetical protein
LNAGRVVEVGRLARGAARRGRVAALVRLLACRVRRRRGHSAGRLEREDFGSRGSVGCVGLLHGRRHGLDGYWARGVALRRARPGLAAGGSRRWDRGERSEGREERERAGWEREEWKGDVGGGGCSA